MNGRPLHNHYVQTRKAIIYGNPGERRELPAGSKAIAEAATNLPHNSAVHYWLLPIGSWPEDVKQWSASVGCGAHSDELIDLRKI